MITLLQSFRVFRQRVDVVLCANVVGVFDGAGQTAVFRVGDAFGRDGKDGSIRFFNAEHRRGNFWAGLRYEYRIYGCVFTGFMV